jgi:5-hydroxyisourate hydrolase
MSKISAHVLDTTRGRPAADLRVRLDVLDEQGSYREVAHAVTTRDGRIGDLLMGNPLEARTYRVVFEVEAYLVAAQQPVFYPRVEVTFRVHSTSEHYHIPLLLSPYGYSTYRGS